MPAHTPRTRIAAVLSVAGVSASTPFVILPMAALTGCASTGIAVKERLGYAKREQLVDAVDDAREEQEEAKVQFESALEELLSLPGTDGGELEDVYDRLRKQLARSEDRADDVRDQIRTVDRVATALFSEWEAELEGYSSAELRNVSADQLSQTRARYDTLLASMRRAERSMDPVLDALGDQVLFLKHNLNARAIASLDTTLAGIESDVGALIAEMNASIAEAEAFINSMNGSA